MVLVLLCLGLALGSNFELSSVERTIDLKGKYSQITNQIKLENTSEAPLSKFQYSIPLEDYSYLALITAHIEGKPNEPLRIERTDSTSEFYLFKITVSKGVPSKGSVNLVVKEIYAHKLTPLPKSIGIFEEQLLLCQEYLNLPSPYLAKNSKTTVKLPSDKLESYTKPQDGKFYLKGNDLVYGPYTNVGAFSNATIQIHYENSQPIPYFTSVERQIEISHWGNVAVTEFYSLVNEGASLKGEFSRIDYGNRYRPSGLNALERMQATLPRFARALYFRDELGNVSTSRASKQVSQASLSIEPRFPIFGGWRSNFVIGYDMPIQHSIKNEGDKYMLNTTFGFPFKEIIADELIVKVILPEGSDQIQHTLPFEVEEVSSDSMFSYLDITGRPVVVFKKKYAVDFHRQPFQVTYHFNKVEMLREPLMLSGMILCVLASLICGFRFNLELDKSLKLKKE